MADRVVEMDEGFFSIRGSFRIAGLVDIGTHASLVRLSDGRFAMLDSYTLSGEVEARVAELTDNGATLAAILNVHPFHTVHVGAMHRRFPKAKLYGTARHADKAPDLPWEPLHTENPELHALFADDLAFSVPAGVQLVTSNDNVHFSSVLVRHRASGIVHVDDTLSYVKMPSAVRFVGLTDVFVFHPTLSAALHRAAGAAAAFRTWAQDLATDWRDAKAMCTAHIGIWRASEGDAFDRRVLGALERVSSTLTAHAARYG